MSERYGKLEELLENINGSVGQLVYLSDSNPDALAGRFNEIKAAKQIVNAYSQGGKHYLAIYLDANIKIKKRDKV